MWNSHRIKPESERARIMHTLAKSDYQLITTDPDRVRYLRSLELSYGIISKSLQIPLTTVKRCYNDQLKKPATPFVGHPRPTAPGTHDLGREGTLVAHTGARPREDNWHSGCSWASL